MCVQGHKNGHDGLKACFRPESGGGSLVPLVARFSQRRTSGTWTVFGLRDFLAPLSWIQCRRFSLVYRWWCALRVKALGMRRLVLTIALFSGLAVPASAQAEEVVVHHGFVTGNEYRSLTAVQRRAYVAGWVDGVYVSVLFGAPDHTQAGAPLAAMSQCVVGMSVDQLDAIFSKWLGEHPERWHEPGHILMYLAMDEVCHFPPEP